MENKGQVIVYDRPTLYRLLMSIRPMKSNYKHMKNDKTITKSPNPLKMNGVAKESTNSKGKHYSIF